MTAIESTNASRERNFRSREFGRFSCALAEGSMSFAGVENVLKFRGSIRIETVVVPDYLLPEARRVIKRGGGDKLLDFAGLCIRFEVACAAFEKRGTHQ